jgi:tRNA (Thr-GGU) A37 N-methylase
VLNLGLQVQQDQGVVRQNGTGGTEVEVRKGSTTALSGSGLLPRSTVQVFLPLQGSNSKELARIPVDDTGSFSGDAVFATRVNERPLPIGRQVLQVVSLDENGQQSVVEMTVNIAQSAPTPEPDRTAGATPTLRPGQSLATNAGEPEIVTVVPLPEDKSAVVEGDGWQMAVNIAGDNGGVTRSSEGGAVLELVRDETAVVSGSGFMPLTRADVWLFSDPTLLGTVDIDENGEFNGEVNVDGNVVAVGEHTLQLQGVGEDGYVRAANLGVVVNDVGAPVTTEEAAGGFLWWLWIVVVLVAILVWFAIWRYRRSQSA